ncbi:RNA exonuclease 5 isoform X1 [Patella vulgata]|uniref:RNA exonuclease 5 isoform X1 n=2 Tax=Patella vulgata TaxID=6465 RepID=UPI00217FD821|nr:RNA exonuclease 5 isoform X1 [Patella vulgata]
MSKREKRVESKIKKARAFLNLARLNKEEDNCKKMKGRKRNIEDDNDSSQSTKKKLKMNNGKNLIEVNGDRSKLPLQMLTEEEMVELIERRKAAMEKPKIYLTLKDLAEEYRKRISKLSENDVTEDTCPSLYALDLQCLILNAIEGSISSYFPRWCKLLRQSKITSIVVMVINGVSLSDVLSNEDCFSYLTTNLPMHIEITPPLQYESSFEKEIFRVRLSESQWAAKIRDTKYSSQEPCKKVNGITNKADSRKLSEFVPADPVDKFDRRLLLLNVIDMIQDGYPLPLLRDGMYNSFKFTKDDYMKLTANSPMFAVDCEMCATRYGRELSRIAVVNEKLEVLMDRLVKPRNDIIDYKTRFSGITEEMLRNVATRLEDVQKEFQQLIPADAILIGHSFCNDLIALRMFHPYVIDTSVIYNLGKKNYKSGLSTLTRYFLKKHIQISLNGHSPVEDAIATMELVLLKLRTGVDFGDMLSGCTVTSFNLSEPVGTQETTGNSKTITDGKSVYFNPTDDQLSQTLFDILNKVNKTNVVIGRDHFPIEVIKGANVVAVDNDTDCVKKAKKLIKKKQFVWLSLEDCVEEKKLLKKKSYKYDKFRQIDGQIQKIAASCQPHSLFIPVFSGKTKKGQILNSGAYVHIT